jgi:N-acyl-D-aspartate/D-glutamate deacylase
VLDLAVTGALIVDGTGSAPFLGSVGVEGDRIAWVGREGVDVPAAARSIEARGAVLSPGFVDVHNHSDLAPWVTPSMPSTIRQGVTTVVVGNCGSSPWPLAGFAEGVRLVYGDPAGVPVPGWGSFGDYLDEIDGRRPAANIAALVGHGSIRSEVMGSERRPPSPDELERMRRLVSEAMAAGAVGLSTGLIYVPGIHGDTDEVVTLAAAAATAGGIYASHIRGEGRDLFRAVDEALEIGRRAELPVHISHLKCESARVWGRADDLLERIHSAPDATGDQYPYEAWNSSLASLLPPWAEADALPTDAAILERLRHAVEMGEPDFQSSIDGVGWDRIVVVDPVNDRWRGQDLATIATAMGVEPFDALVTVLREGPETSCVGHAMDPSDVRTILSDPEVMVASDASAIDPSGASGDLPVHPREYGTFPRALALARDERLMPLPPLIRTMTSLPAERFGLRDRGRIVEGAYADLVLFDAEAVRDTATYEAPQRFPEGIRLVVVNGALAWQHGNDRVERAGRALRSG